MAAILTWGRWVKSIIYLFISMTFSAYNIKLSDMISILKKDAILMMDKYVPYHCYRKLKKYLKKLYPVKFQNIVWKPPYSTMVDLKTIIPRNLQITRRSYSLRTRWKTASK